MKHFQVFEIEIGFKIRLFQTGKDRWLVEYGKQKIRCIDYSRAAHELGACIMHALTSEGKINNE